MPESSNTPARSSSAPGIARCPGPSVDDVLDTETRPVPEFLRGESYEYMGSEPLDAARYTSPEYFRREIEKMWPRVWQFAARDEELPEPGDYIVYENAGRSYLIVRQADGSVKALHNVCLHRGRRLRAASGSADQFKCPFHGFTWNTDGGLKEIPCRWDFPHLTDADMNLPEASVGRWGGYIFVREAAEGPTLEEYLAPLPAFFERWRHHECVTSVWVGKVVRANWKVTSEAFMEAFHSIETHPEILAFTADANTRYNVHGDNVNFAFTLANAMSPHVDPTGKTQQWIVDEFLKYNGRAGTSDLRVPVGENETAREAMGAFNRRLYTEQSGYSHEHALDAELMDNFTYNVFPNFSPWGGFMPNIVFRWRPWPDHETTLMEVRFLTRVPVGTEPPRSVEMHFLEADEPWSNAAEIGVLGYVLDQDVANMGEVQAGLRFSKTGKVNLGNYQEIRLRHFNRTMEKYLSE